MARPGKFGEVAVYEVEVAAPGVAVGLTTLDDVFEHIPGDRHPEFLVADARPLIRLEASDREDAIAVVQAAVAASNRAATHVVDARPAVAGRD